jgi:hypothetical protein
MGSLKGVFVIIGWVFIPYIMAPIYIFTNLDALRSGDTNLRPRAIGGALWALVVLVAVTQGDETPSAPETETTASSEATPEGASAPAMPDADAKKDDDGDGVLNFADCAPADANNSRDKTQDQDCDGLANGVDCEPATPSKASNEADRDCDSVEDDLDCNPDAREIATLKTEDKDCDGLKDSEDCEPDVVSKGSNVNDTDCDGIPNASDCNPTGSVDDHDCDGTPNDVDCAPANPSIKTTREEDANCDGTPEVRVEAFGYVKRFKNMNELKQSNEKEKFPGTLLQGSGKVFEVGKCGFTDKSEDHGDDCVKLTLDKGDPRVVLYFDPSEADAIINLRKGSRYTFNNCTATDITDWGFWATATCDMPMNANPRRAAPAASGESAPSDDVRTSSAGQRLEAFAHVRKFKNLNELKQAKLAGNFEGALLHGTGKVTEVGECSFTDDSNRHGSDCVKITLDKGDPRVVLYLPASKADQIMNLSNGDSYRFENCTAISLKDWGFWATATCDMPD